MAPSEGQGRQDSTLQPRFWRLGVFRSACLIKQVGVEHADFRLPSTSNGAIDVVEQLEPRTYSAVSLAELYAHTSRWDDVIALTEGPRTTTTHPPSCSSSPEETGIAEEELPQALAQWLADRTGGPPNPLTDGDSR